MTIDTGSHAQDLSCFQNRSGCACDCWKTLFDLGKELFHFNVVQIFEDHGFQLPSVSIEAGDARKNCKVLSVKVHEKTCVEIS